MLRIEQNKNTPLVLFDTTNDVYEIRGKCFPENSRKYFQQFHSWLESWSVPEQPINMTIALDYLSSSSAIELIKFFNAISKLPNGENVNVTWLYESDDDEGRKSGENFKNACHLAFELRVLA